MDSTRWQRMQELFHEALNLPVPDQHSFLAVACGDDEALAADVLAMLQEDARGESLLDRGLAGIAQEALANADPATAIKEFGPYRIQRVLGEGGMGVVYLAERSDLGSQVAVKVLRDAWLSPARRDRFASEQQTLAQLNHPSIARLYDADTLADGTPWFVMEYVEGVPLTEYCAHKKCPVEERLRLFRSVCEAVQYAHQHAIIHRDLKPSNILVKADGSVRLLDFGIAKQIESLDTPVDQTRTGLRLMTPAYAAPEQIRGERIGIQTDVYSLGVILYELLAGRLPFDLSKLTPGEAATVVVECDPSRPSTVSKPGCESGHVYAPAVSPAAWADLDVLCLTAMHKDPQRRYQSVEALIRDLDHYLNGEPLETRPDTLRYRAGKFVGRNRRSVTATVVVFAVVVGLVIFFTVRLTIARNAALAEAARTQRIQQFMLNLFQGGDEAAGPSDTLRVVTLLDRGVQEAQSLGNEPAVQAELYQTLGGIYQKLGKLEQADTLLRKALEQRRSRYGPESREAAESLVALALLRADQAQLEEAERLARQGLEMSKRHLPPDHPVVAKATFALGKVLENRGRYGEAIQMLEEAVTLQSASDKNPDLAASLSELANSHFYAGHYDTSDSLNQQALGIQKQLYGEQHPLVADTLINLGAIQFQLGHYREAEQFTRQALEVVEAWYGKDHPETADTMTILAQALSFQQRYDEAATLLKQSLAILEHAYGPVHPRVAFALNELGNVAKRQGNLDDAEGAFRREIEIYRSVYHDKHYLIALAMSNLGGVYAQRKQYVRAEQLFREALQRYSGLIAPDHVNVAIAHVRLGNALLGQKRYAEAEVESRTGYEILSKKVSPSVNWLKVAREDLAAEYDALKQPENAARFKNELAQLSGTARK